MRFKTKTPKDNIWVYGETPEYNSLVGANLDWAWITPEFDKIGFLGWPEWIDFTRASMKGARLEHNTMKGLFHHVVGECSMWNKGDFSGSSFQGANLSGAELKFSNLSGCRFSEARLVSCNFGASDVRQSTFFEANLQSACFAGSDLSETDFTRADLRYADLHGVSMGKYPKIERTLVRKSDLQSWEQDPRLWERHGAIVLP